LRRRDACHRRHRRCHRWTAPSRLLRPPGP